MTNKISAKYPEKNMSKSGANLTFCVMCSITAPAGAAVEQAAFVYQGHSLCHTHFSIEYNKYEESQKATSVEEKVANAVNDATSEHYSSQKSPNFYRKQLGLPPFNPLVTYQIQLQHPDSRLLDIVHYEASTMSELFGFVDDLVRSTRTELVMIMVVSEPKESEAEDAKDLEDEKEEDATECSGFTSKYANFDFGHPLLSDITEYEKIRSMSLGRSDLAPISVNRIRFLRSEMEQSRLARGYDIGTTDAAKYRAGYRYELLRDVLFSGSDHSLPYASVAYEHGRMDGGEARRKSGL